MNNIGSVLEEIRSELRPVDAPGQEYSTLESLLNAYVNGGITHGRYFNILVFGNTLYVDKGNNGFMLFFYQQAIRLTNDVYLFNSQHINDHHYTGKALQRIITEHFRARSVCVSLPMLHKKVPDGTINPLVLREAIFLSRAERSRIALKIYGREMMKARAIQNYGELRIAYTAISDPDRVEISNQQIRDITISLRRARKVCAMVDRYLDVLEQLPEGPAK